jgi:hypothetical protein
VNEPVIEAEVQEEVQEELAPEEWAAAEPTSTPLAEPVPATRMTTASTGAQPLPSAALPVGRPAEPSAIERFQVLGNRVIEEASYQIRRLGATTVAGIAAVVAAATLFLASNLPQSAAVAALKSQLVRLAPVGKGAGVAAPGGAMLAALPPRGDAPNVVSKILEEAKAAGVDLPRGQYEFLPPRDGMAARYRMTFPVHATYPRIRAFMDRTLVALPAVAVEGLRIERKNVGDENVDAELKLAVYVRSDP